MLLYVKFAVDSALMAMLHGVASLENVKQMLNDSIRSLQLWSRFSDFCTIYVALTCLERFWVRTGV